MLNPEKIEEVVLKRFKNYSVSERIRFLEDNKIPSENSDDGYLYYVTLNGKQYYCISEMYPLSKRRYISPFFELEKSKIVNSSKVINSWDVVDRIFFMEHKLHLL